MLPVIFWAGLTTPPPGMQLPARRQGALQLQLTSELCRQGSRPLHGPRRSSQVSTSSVSGDGLLPPASPFTGKRIIPSQADYVIPASWVKKILAPHQGQLSATPACLHLAAWRPAGQHLQAHVGPWADKRFPPNST